MELCKMNDHIWKAPTRYIRRNTARAIAMDAEGKYAFLRIKGVDKFGNRNHLETIGGGIEEGESKKDALIREVQEEIGFACEILWEVGTIIDEYNLIATKTYSTFFAVKLTKYLGNERRTEEERSLISNVEWLDEKKVLEILASVRKDTIDELIQRRDYFAFKTYLKQKQKYQHK